MIQRIRIVCYRCGSVENVCMFIEGKDFYFVCEECLRITGIEDVIDGENIERRFCNKVEKDMEKYPERYEKARKEMRELGYTVDW